MDQINSEILRQFESQGLTINEGIAVDARLIKSASRPLSNNDLTELSEKQIRLLVSTGCFQYYQGVKKAQVNHRIG